MNLPKFERYRSLLKELLSEVLNNAFMLKSELVTDSYGLRRVMTVINVVDEKLERWPPTCLKQQGAD